jgi:hypothetical protein
MQENGNSTNIDESIPIHPEQPINFELPVIDAGALLFDREDKQKMCELALESMHKYGVMVIKDPRIDEKKNQVRLFSS